MSFVLWGVIMRRLIVALTSTVSVVALTHMASAADLRVVTKAPPPLPPPVQDWSGIYVGLEGGYGWGKQNTNFDPFSSNIINAEDRTECTGGVVPTAAPPPSFSCFPDAAIGSVSQSGWLFGGFAGAQKQWGSWVLGIEGDFDGADIKGSQTAFATVFTATTSTPSGTLKDTLNQSHTLNTKIDELGTLRGKIGWAWSPNWMFYGTGGLAWAHARDDFSASQTFCDFRGICRPDLFESVSSVIGGVSSSSGVSMLGWTVGAGLDYKWQLDQGSAVIFGVEYLHYQFGEHSLAFGGPLCACRDDTTFTIGNATQTIDAIKGRISYLFSIH